MLNVGVIGLGVMGTSHAQIYNKIPFVKVAGVCDSDLKRLKETGALYGAKTYADYHELLNDPGIEAVSICMPDNMHVGAVKAAVAAGKHILVEKPIADTLQGAAEIYEAVKDYGKVFTVGYNLRFDPRYCQVRENVKNGSIGEVIHVFSRRNSGIGGPLRFIGHTDLSMHVMVHDINVINWFMPCRPVRVFAKSRSVLLREYHMTDTILAIITYENGALVSMEASWVMNKSWPSAVDDQLEVVGTKGVLYTDGCDHGFKIVTDGRVSCPDTRYRPVINGVYGGALGEELMSFLSSVVNGVPPMVSADEAVLDLKVVDAIGRSIGSGRETEI